MNTELPIEVFFEHTKKDIITLLNNTIETSKIPGPIVLLLFKNALLEIENTQYTSIIQEYDISKPASQQEIESAPIKETIKLTPKIKKKIDSLDDSQIGSEDNS